MCDPIYINKYGSDGAAVVIQSSDKAACACHGVRRSAQDSKLDRWRRETNRLIIHAKLTKHVASNLDMHGSNLPTPQLFLFLFIIILAYFIS